MKINAETRAGTTPKAGKQSQGRPPRKNQERLALEKEQREQMAKRLKAARQARYHSQGDAVASLDYRVVADNSVYSRYESGKRDMPYLFLKELCLTWNVDLNELIVGEEAKTPKKPQPPANVVNALEVLAQYLGISAK